MHVIVYGKPNCSLCEDALGILTLFEEEYNLHIEEVNIYDDEILLEKYQLEIPVIEINESIVGKGKIDYDSINSFLKNKNNGEKS
ncbi:glutaredoxin family protein [Gracilibacillus marinus]|jgi:glutaredoxin|uniref:Glutaredoxin family protein n=1 Tax=Gracilibacillus marinus TaxID=630535 RepID=A0ABV8VU47_9BACI